MVRSPVAANLLMLLIILGGLASIGSIRRQIFPDFQSDRIEVTIELPGAGPREVETGLVLRVEDSLKDLQSLERIHSTAAQGEARISAQIRRGSPVHETLADVRARIDSIDTFPADIERPNVKLVLRSQQALGVVVSGDLDEVALRRLAEEIRRGLLELPDVTKVDILGARRWEISVDMPESELRRLGLSLEQVAEAIRQGSSDLPAGRLELGGRESQLRSDHRALTRSDLARLPLISRSDGSIVLLGEVATLRDGLAEKRQWTLLDGRPALMLSISRVGSQDVLRIAEEVQGFVADKRRSLPDSISLLLWQDESRFFRSQIELLVRNAVAGFLLVLLTLSLFLHWRLAWWVSLGVPISFFGTFWWMPAFGMSFNLISLFALILVLGIVVDDAIIVGERVFQLIEQGVEGAEAAARGVHEVSAPVFVSVLTTLIAFAPMLFIPGKTGPAMAAIAGAVILTLLFSLIESVLILPHHLSGSTKTRSDPGPMERLRSAASSRLNAVRDRWYLPWLARSLKLRAMTWIVGVLLLVISLLPLLTGHLRFTFFPPVEAENMVAIVELASGTTPSATEQALRQIADGAAADSQPEGMPSPLSNTLISVGHQPFVAQQILASTGRTVEIVGASLGEVNVALRPAEAREAKASHLLAGWRQRVGSVAGVEHLRYESSMFSAGPTVSLELTSPDLDDLRDAASAMEAALLKLPGVLDISNSLGAGPREINITPLPAAHTLGLSSRDIARQTRHAYFGIEAQRSQRDQDELRIRVSYAKSERDSLEFLRHLPILTPAGHFVPLESVARLDFRTGLHTITRINGKRVAEIAGSAAPHGDPKTILSTLESEVLPSVLADFPNVKHRWAGGQEDQSKAIGGLVRGFFFAMFGIYIVLALFCGSFFQPLVVVAAVPFGLIGAFWGHTLLGLDLNIYSFFGIIALSGVIVNDSLVLVGFYNQARAQGHAVHEALHLAGRARFRPILLTSFTTFAGLAPLMLERSLQAQFLIPMAVSIAFGLLVASLLILFLVPATLALFDRRDLPAEPASPNPIDEDLDSKHLPLTSGPLKSDPLEHENLLISSGDIDSQPTGRY